MFESYRDAFKFLGLVLIVSGGCGLGMFLFVLFILTLIGWA